MAKEKLLVPLFMPPLATMLARAEKVKGSALTETEIMRLRDNAPCIMMDANDAKKMEERRGYRDAEPASDGATISHAFLRLGDGLLEAGGIAMKCESSGIAHSRSRWLELATLSETESDFWSALFDAYVQLPIQSEDDFYTCGMHLLGKP